MLRILPSAPAHAVAFPTLRAAVVALLDPLARKARRPARHPARHAAALRPPPALLRPVPLGLLLALLATSPAASLRAQTLADPVIPVAQLRLGAQGWFTFAEERFGAEGDGVPLVAPLTTPSAALLFPETVDLRANLAEALATDASAFPLRLGASAGRIRLNEIRVPLSADVGVLDWLTVGVTVPMVKTHVEGTLEVIPVEGADLGVNPGVDNLPLVGAFVGSLGTRASEADALAADRCGAEPGSQGCLDAQVLAADLSHAAGAFGELYGTSVLFPALGTAAGDALAARVAEFEARLAAQGLGELEDLPLAAAPLDREGLAELLVEPGRPFGYLAPPGRLGGVWALGDVEARVAVRLLERRGTDEAGEPDGTGWRLVGLGAVRLPTAAERYADGFMLPAPDDGQLDLIAGAYGAYMRPRLALRARASYTVQRAGTVVDRISPLDVPLVSQANRTGLSWDPGDEVEVEVQPAFRVAPALSLGLMWRYLRHGLDTYARVDPTPAAPVEIFRPRTAIHDASTLAVGTEASFHEVGGSLTYRSAGLPGSGPGGFEVFVQVSRAVTGSGIRQPINTRATFGGRALMRLWGR